MGKGESYFAHACPWKISEHPIHRLELCGAWKRGVIAGSATEASNATSQVDT